MSAETKECTCRRCELTFTPSFAFDFYPDGEGSSTGLCERCVMQEAFGTLTEPSPLPAGYVDKVCKRGQGASTCAFLVFQGGFKCAKKSTLEQAIRKRTSEGDMGSKGDNRSGPLDFSPATA